MHAYCKVGRAIIYESGHCRYYTYGRNRDPFRAHTEAPISRKDLKTLQHCLQVVQGLTHTHINYIAELIFLRKALDLIQDFTSIEVTLEALLPSHTKQASHLASNLG